MGDRWRYDLQFGPRQIKLIEEQLFHSINIYIYIYIYIYINIYTLIQNIYSYSYKRGVCHSLFYKMEAYYIKFSEALK